MSTLTSVIQLVVVLSALIILHEIGHYLGARLFKLDVEEFGIGIPPQLLRYWRGKGSLTIGDTRVKIPAGTQVLHDLEKGNWVEAITTRDKFGGQVLRELKVLNPNSQDLSPGQSLSESGDIRLRGTVSALKLGMLFTINWLPLGGFVKIKGEGDTSIPDGLACANPWKRLVVYAFGPLMNLALGVIFYAVIANQLGAADLSRVMVVGIAPNSPAEAAGLQVGDLIESIDQTAVESVNSLQEEIYARLGSQVELTLNRADQVQVVSLVPRENPPEGEGAIGILLGNPSIPIPWYTALPRGAQMTVNHALALLTLPAQVVKGAIAPEDARVVGYKGMYDIYQNVQERELVPGAPQSLNTLVFLATITISLGILNLLPIPALDGGRILFALPEIIIRRRIPIQVQNLVNMVSFTLMIVLFIYINILDFTNPIQLP